MYNTSQQDEIEPPFQFFTQKHTVDNISSLVNIVKKTVTGKENNAGADNFTFPRQIKPIPFFYAGYYIALRSPHKF